MQVTRYKPCAAGVNFTTDLVWIGQPDVNERLVSRESLLNRPYWYSGTSVQHITVGVQACDTSRGRRTSTVKRPVGLGVQGAGTRQPNWQYHGGYVLIVNL